MLEYDKMLKHNFKIMFPIISKQYKIQLPIYNTPQLIKFIHEFPNLVVVLLAYNF
jgi:hypothetical protein